MPRLFSSYLNIPFRKQFCLGNYGDLCWWIHGSKQFHQEPSSARGLRDLPRGAESEHRGSMLQRPMGAAITTYLVYLDLLGE